MASSSGEEFGLVPAKFLKRNNSIQEQNKSTVTTHDPSSSKQCSVVETLASSSSSSMIIMQSVYNNRRDTGLEDDEYNNTTATPTKSRNDLSSSSSLFSTSTKKEDLSLVEKTRRLQELNDCLNRQFSKASQIVDSPYMQEWKEYFLQAEEWNVKQASRRIYQHVKTKQELFGNTKSSSSDDILLHQQLRISWNQCELSKTSFCTVLRNIPPRAPLSSSCTPSSYSLSLKEIWGHVQLLPVRDLAGRALILLKFDAHLFFHHEKAYRQYLFYILSSAVLNKDDDVTKSNGISLIVMNYHYQKQQRHPQQQNQSQSQTQNQSQLEQYSKSNALSSSSLPSSPIAAWFQEVFFDSFWTAWKSIKIPFRISVLHYCIIHPDTVYSLREQYESHSNTEIRIHQGSHQECLHGLLSFGIPSHWVPITQDGEISNLPKFQQWIEWKSRIDSFLQHQQFRIVLVPSREDVLFGCSNTSNCNHHRQAPPPQALSGTSTKHSSPSSHPPHFCQGNVRFHQMILSNAAEYQKASQEEQAIMKRQIWKSIQARKGRFLQPVDNHGTFLWEPVMEESLALSKVGLAFEYIIARHFSNKNNNKDGRDDDNTIHHPLQVVTNMLDFSHFLFLTQECWAMMQCSTCKPKLSCWQCSG